MHISITGDLGSGKSSVAKMLSDKLGYKFLSTGAIQRRLALEKGMNTLEFNNYTDHNKEIDDYIDQHLKDINNINEPYVIDSRLAWFFIKNSFKVYLNTNKKIAAQRILNDNNRISEPITTEIEKKIEESEMRRNSEMSRFKKNYGVKYDINSSFDLVLDTSYISIEEVVQKILDVYQNI